MNLLKSHKLIVWKLVYHLLKTYPRNRNKEQEQYLVSFACSAAKATMMINPGYSEEDGESQMLCEKFSGFYT